jgi:hypothetical protein
MTLPSPDSALTPTGVQLVRTVLATPNPKGQTVCFWIFSGWIHIVVEDGDFVLALQAAITANHVALIDLLLTNGEKLKIEGEDGCNLGERLT